METAVDIAPAFAETAPAAADIAPATDATKATADPVAPHRRYLCRHIFTDGHRCGSTALRGEAFCYHHHTSRLPKPGNNRHIDAWEPFTLGLIEDRASALLVASQILSRIASNSLDSARAGHLIRGLQAIARFLPREPLATRTDEAPAQEPLIEDPIQDETLGPIAPIAELPNPRVDAVVVTTAAANSPTPEADEHEDARDENLYTGLTALGGEETHVIPRPASLSEELIDAEVDCLRQDARSPLVQLTLSKPAPEPQPTPDPLTVPIQDAA